MSAAGAALSAALLLACAGAAHADDWRIEVDDPRNGIRVYLRTTEHGYREFRGLTRVTSRLSAFVALFRDVERMPKWIYRNKFASVLERLSDKEVYAYTVTDMDWPLHDRDAIVHSVLTQDPSTLAVTIRGNARPEFRPPRKDHVRMPVVVSHWRFTPLPSGEVDVEFQGYGDPGGNLSSGPLKWFAQRAIWEAPYQTLLGMRALIGDPVYQSARFEYVAEPRP